MIFEADEDLKKSAADARVYYDWVKDPKAWQAIKDRMLVNDKERKEAWERYETYKIEEFEADTPGNDFDDDPYDGIKGMYGLPALVNIDYTMITSDPSVLLTCGEYNFKVLEEGIKKHAKNHQLIVLKADDYSLEGGQETLAREPAKAEETPVEHKAPYTELNEQVDAIRKNPLLILEASEQVRNAAVNARVCVDWFNDPEAWKVIKDHQTAKDAKEIQSLVAYNRHTNEDYRDFNIDDATGNREGFEIWDDASVVAKTVIHENPAAVFEFKTAEDLDYGKIHFEMEAENENFNFGFEPSPDLERKELKDQYYSIPESHQERAEKAGFVQEKEPNEWRLPPYVNRLSEEVEQVKNVSARIEPVWVNRVEYIRKNVFAEKSTGNIAEGSGETMKALDKLRDRECDPKTFKAGAKFFSAQVKMLKEMDKSGMSGEAKKGITLRQEQLRSSQKMYNVLGRSSPEVARTVKSRVLLAANTLGMDF